MDRRVILEEAAGILKYKKRKGEALRKLDRTHHNLDRVHDIIHELELQVEPLKVQSEKALEYLENKKGLDQYEVALLAYDIEQISTKVENDQKQKNLLDAESVKISSDTSTYDAKSMEDRNQLMRLEKDLASTNQKLLQATEEVERINGERNILKERSFQDQKKEDVAKKLRDLLDEKGRLLKQIEIYQSEINSIRKKKEIEQERIQQLKKEKEKYSNSKSIEEKESSKLDLEILKGRNKMDSISLEIEQGGLMPNSVRSILKQESLGGIHNTIGNLIGTSSTYMKALEVAISASKNFIITEDEKSAKEAIFYLKQHHLGRATFFPLTVIKPRLIDLETQRKIKNHPDFIALLSDVVEYDSKYKNIMENQLGTILIAKDMDCATRLSKAVSHRYKIVTLEGDVVHVGGSMAGGSTYQSKSIFFLKQELEKLKKEDVVYQEEMRKRKDAIEKIRKELERLDHEDFSLSKNQVLEEERLNKKQSEMDFLKKDLEEKEREIDRLKNLEENSLTKIEEELINEYHKKNTWKEKLILEEKNLRESIDSLKEEIEKKEADAKLKNANLKKVEKDARTLEIEITKNNVKLDTMLNTLNEEYSLTYEKAKSEYFLDIEVEEARKKVVTYKNNIKNLGMVNLASIDEFERVNTRYQFLMKQKEDLLGAEDTLLEIMNEMDEVMIEEFSNTFEKIRGEFQSVFKQLFGGGHADLKLTNPDDLLSTGIEIVASPPGKKLTSISLLSGGEKTFTAISLLFAILNVKAVPFCLFEEVEAALDEANVDAFGKYLDHYRKKTQFLIITHKKKTMEFADTLYGITMQESGVSKLVSVKLNDKVELIG